MSKTGTDVFRVTLVKLLNSNTSNFGGGSPLEKLDENAPILIRREQASIVEALNYRPYRMGVKNWEYDLTEDLAEVSDLMAKSINFPSYPYFVTARTTAHVLNCVKEEHVILPEQFDVTDPNNIIGTSEITSMSKSDSKQDIDLKFIPHYGQLTSIHDDVDDEFLGKWVVQTGGTDFRKEIKFANRTVFSPSTDVKWQIEFTMNTNGSIKVEHVWKGAGGVPNISNEHADFVNLAGSILQDKLGLNMIELEDYEKATSIPARVRAFTIKTTVISPLTLDLISNNKTVIGDIGFYICKEGVNPWKTDSLGNKYLDEKKVQDFGYILQVTEAKEGSLNLQGSRTIYTKRPNILVDRTLSEYGEDPKDDAVNLTNFKSWATTPSLWGTPEFAVGVFTDMRIDKFQESGSVNILRMREGDPVVPIRFHTAELIKLTKTLPIGIYTVSLRLLVEKWEVTGVNEGSYIRLGNWFNDNPANYDEYILSKTIGQPGDRTATGIKVSLQFTKTEKDTLFGLSVNVAPDIEFTIHMSSFELELVNPNV